MPQETINKTWLWWSSGKDSAFALHRLRQNPEFEVERLITTFNAVANRVAMHAVRAELVALQAQSLGLPLETVELPLPCSNEIYLAEANKVIKLAEQAGVTHMAFGDLFLTDVRAYREEMLSVSPIQPVFPLWGENTRELAEEMMVEGIEATLTCVDPKVLDASFVGRRFDSSLLADLPPQIDPCGENGEFHSFVSNGPGFSTPLKVKRGIVLERDGFVFADLLLDHHDGNH